MDEPDGLFHDPEYQLADDLAQLFTEAGLETPKPVRVMRADHQVAQKFTPSPSRAASGRDLVDLQLLEPDAALDLRQVRDTCIRLFEYRRQHAWPPTIVAGQGWDILYETAIEGVNVLPDVDAAVAWVNEFVPRSARPGD